jgi:hypothetical protein
VLAVLPEESPAIGPLPLERSAPTLEVLYTTDLDERQWAVEVSYEGLYVLDDSALKDGSALDEHFAAMGGWIASTLVRVGDLPFTYLPAEEEE